MTALIVIGSIAAYFVGASAVGFRLRNSTAGCSRKGCRPPDHISYCDNSITSFIGGVLWPAVPFIYAGWLLANKKKVRGSRWRRAERAAKKIAELEREIYGESR